MAIPESLGITKEATGFRFRDEYPYIFMRTPVAIFFDLSV